MSCAYIANPEGEKGQARSVLKKTRMNAKMVPCAVGDKCRKKGMVDADNPTFKCRACDKGICGIDCMPRYFQFQGSIGKSLKIYVCLRCFLDADDPKLSDDEDVGNIPLSKSYSEVPCACGERCKSHRNVDATNPRLRCHFCYKGICGINCMPETYRFQGAVPKEKRLLVCFSCYLDYRPDEDDELDVKKESLDNCRLLAP